jgi:molybdopterin/thiamine biosynthesis adenylyltransferase
MKVDKNISEDEAALYDRQIRLWGVDAQKKYFSLFLKSFFFN